MATLRVIRDFSKFKDAELETKAQHIVNCLTGNKWFTTPTPTLADMQKAVTDYAAALAQAKDGSKEDVSNKNQKRDDLEELLSSLADYVQLTANGNEAAALSSGFDLARKATKVGILDKPENVKIKQGANTGSVDISCGALDHADYYEYQYTEAPVTANSVWITKTVKKRKLTIDGLVRGKQYVFRIAGAGSAPDRVWSTEITAFVS